MPYKSKEERKAAAAAHYQKNKADYQRRDKERIERNRQFVREYRKTCKCETCGESRPACLDFHHRDSTEKVKSVAELICNRSCLEAIKIEIAKCEVLCANCHRVKHNGNIWLEDSCN